MRNASSPSPPRSRVLSKSVFTFKRCDRGHGCQRRVASLVALAALLAATPLHARGQIQGVFEGSTGFTDNVQSTPEDPPPGVPSPRSDLFGVLSPGVVYAIDSPSQLHRFAYTYSLNLFFRDSDATSSTNRLEYTSVFETSAHSQLVLGASAMQAHQHTSGTMMSSANTLTGSAIPGTGAFLGASAEEAFTLEIEHDWRATQGTGFAMYVPIRRDLDAPSTYAPSARLGLERLFEWNAIGVEARAEYAFVADAVGARGEPLGDQEQVVGTGLGRWRHDWSMWFSSRVRQRPRRSPPAAPTERAGGPPARRPAPGRSRGRRSRVCTVNGSVVPKPRALFQYPPEGSLRMARTTPPPMRVVAIPRSVYAGPGACDS